MRTDLLRVRRAAPVLVLVLMLMLAGCGPGSGGTGLPPASTGLPVASGETTGAVDAPAHATLPPPGGAAHGVLAGPLSGGPDLVGRVEALDATRVRVAGVDIELARVDLQFGDGSPAPATALVLGAQLQVWRVGERRVVRLGS